MSATKAVFVLIHGGWHTSLRWSPFDPAAFAAFLAGK